MVFRASTHACLRLRERVPNYWDADIYRLRRILVALCYQGKRLTAEPWNTGQYYLASLETDSNRWLVLVMQSLPDYPQTSLVVTVLWADQFALRGMFA